MKVEEIFVNLLQGVDCELNINDCEDHQCDHGECQDRNGTYTCDCEDGYRGRFCQEDIDECAAEPCVHSVKCIDKVNAYR